MKIIGLTGGIGSGKTTVAKMFEALGMPVFIADKVAKNLMETSKELKADIINILGDESYKDNQPNRAFIASLVFNNKEKLDALNAVVHPKVNEYFKDWLKKQNAIYVIYEAAIIFELNRQDQFDKTILVTLDKEIRIKRLLERDDTTRAAIVSRMENQWPESKKEPLADFVIINKSYEKTKVNVEKIHKSLIN